MSVSRALLSIMMVVLGITHFVFTPAFVAIVPAYLPWHRELVLVSGVIEIGLGLLLATEWARSFAAWALIALFVAVYPANINMALNPVTVPGVPGSGQVPPMLAWLRLPLQFVFMWWAYQFTDRARGPAGRRATAR